MSSQFRCRDTGTPLTVARREFRRIVEIDDYADLSWLDPELDRARLTEYERGDWHMIGIVAAADILIPLGPHFVIQTMTSPGLWGVESDAADSYLDQVFADECANLAAMLAAMGIAVTE